MSIVTLKKKALAQYKTQNGLSTEKKEISYCNESCKSQNYQPAFINIDQVFTKKNTFTVLPKSSAVPINNDDLVTKSYVDLINSTSDTATVTINNNQTISGIKTFNNLPVSSAIPTTNDQFVTKSYVDGAQTITGQKTFNAIPICPVAPSADNQLVNKSYVDSSFVNINFSQTITGQKTFNAIPICPVAPSAGNQLVNKSYVDNSGVTIGSNQTITGQKTFDAIPICQVAPLTDNQLVNKFYADSSILSKSIEISMSTDLNVSSNISTHKNSTVRITSTNNYKLTIPLPNALSNSKFVTFYQNTSKFEIRLVLTAGSFGGKYGSGGSELIVLANTWVHLFSDGTNYTVTDRSTENQIYNLNFSQATASIETNFQYVNAEVRLTSTFVGEVDLTIPESSVAQTLNQTYVFCNDNDETNPNTINLKVTSSFFKGFNCDNAGSQTSLRIPIKTKVVIFNNGANWIVREMNGIGSSYFKPMNSGGNDYTITRPFQKFTVLNTYGDNVIIKLPPPLPSDVGCEVTFSKGTWTNNASGNLLFDTSSNGAALVLVGSSTLPTKNSALSAASRIVKLTVIQYGYKGNGRLTATNSDNTIEITAIDSSNTLIGYGATISFSGFLAQIEGRNTTATGGGIGLTGKYKMDRPSTVGGTNLSFTIENSYIWTVI